ncbi:MAG: TspO/MBR family protein [Burkholderiales bacterium]
MPRPSLWKPLAGATAVALLTGWIGRLLTDLGPWYYGLSFPPWKPPDWLFGPAWTTIYVLAVASFVSVWRNGPEERRPAVLGLFAINIVFHLLWSALFFTWKRPDLALVEVAFLWLSILAPVLAFWRWWRPAALMLLPYLAWVTFASALNASIVMRNGPFG